MDSLLSLASRKPGFAQVGIKATTRRPFDTLKGEANSQARGTDGFECNELTAWTRLVTEPVYVLRIVEI